MPQSTIYRNTFKTEKVVLKLLFLVAVRATAFFALVRRYLMSFSFFTTWHTQVFFNVPILQRTGLLLLFYVHIGFYTFYKNFCRFEGWNIVGWNLNGCIL